MNRVQLVGVVIWPIELSHDRNRNQTFAKAMIAVSSGEQDLDFVPVTLRGREAADAARYLGEGSRVDVVGHIHSVLVTDRDAHGHRRTRRVLHVIADQVTYLVVHPPRAGDRP